MKNIFVVPDYRLIEADIETRIRLIRAGYKEAPVGSALIYGSGADHTGLTIDSVEDRFVFRQIYEDPVYFEEDETEKLIAFATAVLRLL